MYQFQDSFQGKDTGRYWEYWNNSPREALAEQHLSSVGLSSTSPVLMEV